MKLIAPLIMALFQVIGGLGDFQREVGRAPSYPHEVCRAPESYPRELGRGRKRVLRGVGRCSRVIPVNLVAGRSRISAAPERGLGRTNLYIPITSYFR